MSKLTGRLLGELWFKLLVKVLVVKGLSPVSKPITKWKMCMASINSCVRPWSSLRQRTYAVDRLKTPMKRIGERGDGKYVPITWDEATTLIADKLRPLDGRGFRSGSGAYYILLQTTVLTVCCNAQGCKRTVTTLANDGSFDAYLWHLLH